MYKTETFPFFFAFCSVHPPPFSSLSRFAGNLDRIVLRAFRSVSRYLFYGARFPFYEGTADFADSVLKLLPSDPKFPDGLDSLISRRTFGENHCSPFPRIFSHVRGKTELTRIPLYQDSYSVTTEFNYFDHLTMPTNFNSIHLNKDNRLQ